MIVNMICLREGVLKIGMRQHPYVLFKMKTARTTVGRMGWTRRCDLSTRLREFTHRKRALRKTTRTATPGWPPRAHFPWILELFRSKHLPFLQNTVDRIPWRYKMFSKSWMESIRNISKQNLRVRSAFVFMTD